MAKDDLFYNKICLRNLNLLYRTYIVIKRYDGNSDLLVDVVNLRLLCP